MTKRNSVTARSRSGVLDYTRSNGRRQRLFIRLSAIRRMHKVGAISDAEMAAAERFNMLWESANADGLAAFDYSRQRVDGRGHGLVGLSDRRLWARQKLERIRRAVGEREYQVLIIAVGNERSLADVRVSLRCASSKTSNIVKSALENLSMVGVARGAGHGIRSDISTNVVVDPDECGSDIEVLDETG